MIDLVYQIVTTILNKELRGNITPSEFNLVANKAQSKIFRDYFHDIQKEQYKDNRGYGGKGLANLPQKIRQKIDLFSARANLTYDTDRFKLPSNLYWIKDRGVLYGTTVVDEGQVSRSSFKSSSKTSASVTFPQYHLEGDSLIVTPSSINSGVSCRYIRKPLAPKWTYNVVLNTEVFNPGANDYQDFELHESELENLVIEILSDFGINLRETDVTQLIQQIRNNEESKKQ